MSDKNTADLITESEAASVLRISQSTLRRIRYANEIAYYRVASRVFYSHQHINDFLSLRENKRREVSYVEKQ